MARGSSPLMPATSSTPPQDPLVDEQSPGECSARQHSTPKTASSFCFQDGLFAAALLTAVFLAYQPAWHGAPIWDDDGHLTRPALQSWHGLWRIWFELGATQQYYPLLHTAFWLQHRLWGEATLGYHLVNILLHAASALLVAIILRRLAIPGAYLAAAIFALHPVAVESVAWISELKNILSGIFYLSAMLLYLRFDQTRQTRWYGWALGLFVLGLLSKTVTATLPAALLVIFWWQRGRLSWRRDVWPLAPFFLLGAVAGLLTAWVERNLIGAEGIEFELTIVERCLLAGRVICFYLGKLFWPTELIFSYPRWHVSQTTAWQYLFPAAAILLLALLWRLRGRWRGPLAGLLFFVGTLFPVLGFCNVYPFVYSFVADHFQYLASLGIITLASAGVALLLERCGLWRRPAGYMACLTLLATLGTLTWRQSRMYADIDALYQTTIDRNPSCWMAYNNLGNLAMDRGRRDEALAYYQKALQIKPDHVNSLNNLGNVLAIRGRWDEAIACYRKALSIEPGSIDAHYNFGTALAARGRFDEAIAQYQTTVELKPDHAQAHNNLANALAARGRFDEALAHYRRAAEILPDDARTLGNLGAALAARGQFDEAVAQCRKALEIKPDDVEIRYQLGVALAGQGRFPEALTQYREALRINPKHARVHSSLAWLRATCPQAAFRNGVEAVEQAQQAAQLSGGRQPSTLDTLAAAYAEAGWFPEALGTARKALDLAVEQRDRRLADALRARIALYEAGKPYRETPSASTPVRQQPP